MSHSSDSTTRICTMCGVEYPATTEYFGVHKQGKYGLRSLCRSCKSIHDEQYRLENKEALRAKNAEYQRLHPEKGRERTRRYRGNHPERVRERTKEYRQRNPERVKSWQRDNYQKHRGKRLISMRQYHQSRDRVILREYGREATRRWRQQHPEESRQSSIRSAAKWRASNPEKARILARAWSARYPERKRASDANNRARRRGAEGSHTAKDIELMFTSQSGRCWYCECDLNESGFHIDHRIPISRGGTNWPSNLVLACPKCNLSKHDRLPHEWNGRLL